MKKSELNAESIKKILPQVLREHDKNANEIDYLYNYYKGKQPILDKKKVVRPEINNKVLENHAFEIVEFKKAYVFGEPVQYVQKGEKDNRTINPEISELNKFMESEDKPSRDKEIGEWDYIAGTAYRWTDIDNDADLEDEDAPFEIRTLDPRRTFVVYNSGVRGEQLFSGYINYFSENIQLENGETQFSKYRIITIYTEDAEYQYKESFGNTGNVQNLQIMQFDVPSGIGNETVKSDSYPIEIKGHRIIEYPLNQARLGLIELCMSALNAINQVKSDDLDGIDQFIQSLLVFINQEIDVDKFKQLVQAGAVEVSSSDPAKPADVKLLINQLVHSETKIVTDDLYNNVLTICGIPRLNHKASGGDTGQARLLGEGWTMADERAKQDEMFFKMCSKEELKIILMICRLTPNSGINTLTIKDVEQKFTRNKSDNFLVKSQGMMNQIQSGIAPEVAITTSGLYSDSNEVYNKTMEFYGGIENWIKLFVDKASKQLNDTKVADADKQEGGKTLTAEDDKKSQV